MIVYICVGNSDDQLSQAEWVGLIAAVDRALGLGLPVHLPQPLVHVHGRWFSAPDVPWQSACWCIEFEFDRRIVTGDARQTTIGLDLHYRLSLAARKYRQDSIAWAQVPITELIKPLPEKLPTGLEDIP